MPRPFRFRKVCCRPDSNYFKPRGIPLDALDEVNLTMDELEAIRLADLKGMYQEDAAKKMNVSRQTFGNIIISAHKKIADSLVNSKALKIEGGVIKMMERFFSCSECKHEWTLPMVLADLMNALSAKVQISTEHHRIEAGQEEAGASVVVFVIAEVDAGGLSNEDMYSHRNQRRSKV